MAGSEVSCVLFHRERDGITELHTLPPPSSISNISVIFISLHASSPIYSEGLGCLPQPMFFSPFQNHPLKNFNRFLTVSFSLTPNITSYKRVFPKVQSLTLLFKLSPFQGGLLSTITYKLSDNSSTNLSTFLSPPPNLSRHLRAYRMNVTRLSRARKTLQDPPPSTLQPYLQPRSHPMMRSSRFCVPLHAFPRATRPSRSSLSPQHPGSGHAPPT